ncbi:MAG: phosphoglucosamine mutase, partial [Flavobacteriales bacterium]
VVEQGKSLHELASGFEMLPQTLVNVRLKQVADPFADLVLAAAFASAEQALKGKGRLLIRKSGTEPMIRVMVEGQDAAEVAQMAQELADLVRQQLGG